MPNPKTIADHKREGTYRDDRHGDRMPENEWHTGGQPEPPANMTPRQQYCWNQVVNNIRPENLARIDSMAIMAAARWFEQWADAMAACEADGVTPKDHWTALCRAGMAWKHLQQLMSRFGMTPGDRSKFKKAAASQSFDNPIKSLVSHMEN